MRIAKQSHYNKADKDQTSYVLAADNDLTNIFNVFKGRVRFGDGNNGGRGENISGEFRVFTTDATPGVESAIAHTLGATPVGWLVCNKNGVGDLYASTTAWDSSRAYFKCSAGSITFTIFLLK